MEQYMETTKKNSRALKKKRTKKEIAKQKHDAEYYRSMGFDVMKGENDLKFDLEQLSDLDECDPDASGSGLSSDSSGGPSENSWADLDLKNSLMLHPGIAGCVFKPRDNVSNTGYVRSNGYYDMNGQIRYVSPDRSGHKGFPVDGRMGPWDSETLKELIENPSDVKGVDLIHMGGLFQHYDRLKYKDSGFSDIKEVPIFWPTSVEYRSRSSKLPDGYGEDDFVLHIDNMINQRRDVCKRIISKYYEKSKTYYYLMDNGLPTRNLMVFSRYNYPCIMVGCYHKNIYQAPSRSRSEALMTIQGPGCSDKMISSSKVVKMENKDWTAFCMVMYQGLVNAFLRHQELPVSDKYEISERSSFGHEETSLAECNGLFRINIGNAGNQQIDAIVAGLDSLDQMLNKWKSPSWLLKKTIEARYSRTWLHEFVRTKIAKQFIINRTFKLMTDKFQRMLSGDYNHRKNFPTSDELNGLLEKLKTFYEIKKENNKMKTTLNQRAIERFLTTENDSDPSARIDDGEIVGGEGREIQEPIVKMSLQDLHRTVLINDANKSCEDSSNKNLDFGSDSECEEIFMNLNKRGSVGGKRKNKNKSLYSQKLTVSSCMNAITALHDSALNEYFELMNNPESSSREEETKGDEQGSTSADINKYMYYEYESSRYEHLLKKSDGDQGERICLDVNPCVNTFENAISKVKLKDFYPRVHIFDITSSTSDEIIDVILARLASGCNTTVFVRSGTKFECDGLDINPYGEIRIFSTKRGIVKDMMTVLMNRKIAIPVGQKCHALRRMSLNMYSSFSNAYITEGVRSKIDNDTNLRRQLRSVKNL